MIDFRSDTVTRPSPAMRRAMAEAEVGDDVFGDDPTVQRLEATVAEILGKEAALFVPSGTMANQLALSVLTRPGDEVLAEAGAHVFNYEGGAPAALWGVQIRTVNGERGRIHPDQIRGAVRPEDEHFAPLAAVAFENTHNRAGGAVWPPDALRAAAETAHELGLRVHLDGARLWNAAVASGKSPADLAAGADTVSVCFSKGLGAPVGSALASTRDLVRRARFHRKRLGGGMRQVGVLAAAALHALEHHREGLAEDHARARRIADHLARLRVTVLPVETNIVILDLEGSGRSQEDVVAALAAQGVAVIGFGATRIRITTHRDVTDTDVDTLLAALDRVLGDGA